MDVLDILKTDHDRIRRLFARFQEATDPQIRFHLFHAIRYELDHHTYAEETCFYPEFSKFDSFREALPAALAEHHRTKLLLEDLRELVPNHPELFKDRMDHLIQVVSGHLLEEEAALFPKVLEVTNSGERAIMGSILAGALGADPIFTEFAA